MACALYFKSSEAMWLLYLRNKPKLNLITAILHLQWAANFWDRIWHWIRSTVSQWSVRLLNESFRMRFCEPEQPIHWKDQVKLRKWIRLCYFSHEMLWTFQGLTFLSVRHTKILYGFKRLQMDYIYDILWFFLKLERFSPHYL